MIQVIISDTQNNKIIKIVDEIFENYNVNNKIKGKKVLVKPNLLGPFPPERCVTTDPRLIQAIVKKLKSCEAKEIIVGDNSGSIHFNPLRIAKVTGILDASDGCFTNLAKEIIEVEVKSQFMNKISISKYFIDTDYIINVPKFKTHGLTTITGAIKNMYGIIPGGKKAQLHTFSRSVYAFSELLMDIYQIRIPDLNIMDAIIGMEGNGPTNGKPRVINKIISSDNGVSLDSVMAMMMGLKPESIALLSIAKKRNLGEINKANLDILGKLEAIPGYKTPNHGLVQKIKRAAVPYVFNFAKVKPVINQRKCTLCKRCMQVCPVSAIRMNNSFPEVNREKCISCFCCDEHCFYGAIILPSWSKDLFNRIRGK